MAYYPLALFYSNKAGRIRLKDIAVKTPPTVYNKEILENFKELLPQAVHSARVAMGMGASGGRGSGDAEEQGNGEGRVKIARGFPVYSFPSTITLEQVRGSNALLSCTCCRGRNWSSGFLPFLGYHCRPRKSWE